MQRPGPLASLAHKHGGGSRSASTSVSYDYSAVDEARQAEAKAKATGAEAAQAAYGGDIGAAMSAGERVRALRDQAAKANAQGVRVSSTSASANSSGPDRSSEASYHEPLANKAKRSN